jgi:hypothetical protein
MAEPERGVRSRYRRVDQKLKDLARKTTQAKELADRIAGTSEETADLFSSGTTPFRKMTIHSP